MKIGIFGGTFNPIHKGHLHLASGALAYLELDKVLFMPTNKPPHKKVSDLADTEHRINMCKLATRSDPRFEVSDIEFTRGGVSYTVDTLRELKKIYPDDRLYFLMGSDMFLTMLSWREPEEIFKMTSLAAIARGHEEKEKLEEYAEVLKSYGADCAVADIRPMPMSSTRVRAEILFGGAGRDVVDTKVYDYIWQNSLYGLDAKDYPYNSALYTNASAEMLSPERDEHSSSVAKQAVRLAKIYGARPEAAFIAGRLHDIAKELPPERMLELMEAQDIFPDEYERENPQLWHGPAGAAYIKEEFNILATDILNAVRYHTTGRRGMSLLEKIIYVADLTEEGRDFPGVDELRETADRDLDAAVREKCRFTAEKLRAKNIRPAGHTKDLAEELGLL